MEFLISKVVINKDNKDLYRFLNVKSGDKVFVTVADAKDYNKREDDDGALMLLIKTRDEVVEQLKAGGMIVGLKLNAADAVYEYPVKFSFFHNDFRKLQDKIKEELDKFGVYVFQNPTEPEGFSNKLEEVIWKLDDRSNFIVNMAVDNLSKQHPCLVCNLMCDEYKTVTIVTNDLDSMINTVITEYSKYRKIHPVTNEQIRDKTNGYGEDLLNWYGDIWMELGDLSELDDYWKWRFVYEYVNMESGVFSPNEVELSVNSLLYQQLREAYKPLPAEESELKILELNVKALEARGLIRNDGNQTFWHFTRLARDKFISVTDSVLDYYSIAKSILNDHKQNPELFELLFEFEDHAIIIKDMSIKIYRGAYVFGFQPLDVEYDY